MGNILLFFSGGEIMVVVFFVLLFFGADAIPGLARTIGKGMREFNKATADLKNELVPSNERQDHLRFWPSVANLSAVRPKL